MKNKFTLIAFSILCVIQLAVPFQMIWEKEDALSNGTPFKFKTAPIDPSDPFRGKYVSLNYAINEYIPVENPDLWERGVEVYVSLEEDENGYAKISLLSSVAPEGSSNYFKTSIRGTSKSEIAVDFYFDRFYMDEMKAPVAETMLRNTNFNLPDTATTYAIVYVKDGNAVIDDVQRNGISISDYVEQFEN